MSVELSSVRRQLNSNCLVTIQTQKHSQLDVLRITVGGFRATTRSRLGLWNPISFSPSVFRHPPQQRSTRPWRCRLLSPSVTHRSTDSPYRSTDANARYPTDPGAPPDELTNTRSVALHASVCGCLCNQGWWGTTKKNNEDKSTPLLNINSYQV